MISDCTKIRTPCGIPFDAVMPPLMKAYGLRSTALSIPHCTGYRYGTSDGFLAGSGASRVVMLGSEGSRSVETALLRREIDLRCEFERLRSEDEARRQQEEAQLCRNEERDERDRMMELALQIENERARRVEAQQERLLKRERELDEWRLARTKEADQQHQRRIEEEERRRERRYEMDMERLKEQASLREAAAKDVSNIDKALETALEHAKRSMTETFEAQLQAREEVHQMELKRRDEAWHTRYEKMELQRTTELANLQHQLSQDVDRAERSERHLTETRSQLSKLLSEVESLKEGYGGSGKSREATQALTAMHKVAIERLQTLYDDDKRDAQRRFRDDLEHQRSEAERQLEHQREQHAAQLRGKDEELAALERRVAHLQRELQEEKTRASLATSSHPFGDADMARMKEEQRALRKTAQSLEDTKQRLERRLREADEAATLQATTIQALQVELQTTRKQHTAQLDELRSEHEAAQRSHFGERESLEDEVAGLRKQLRVAEEEARSAGQREVEASLHQQKEKYAEERRQWTAEKAQLTRRLKTAEDEAAALRHGQERLLREASTNRDSVQQRMMDLEEKAARVHHLESELEAKRTVEAELREATMRLQTLQEKVDEGDRRWQQHTTTLSGKEREVHLLRQELAEAERREAELRDTAQRSRFSLDEEQQRQQRAVFEKDSLITQLKGQMEEERQSVLQWKSKYEDLQRRNESSVQEFKSTLRYREEELREVSTKLRLAEAAVEATGRALRERESTAMQDGESARLLRERDEEIYRLTREVRELREQVDRLRAAEHDQTIRQTHSITPAPVPELPSSTATAQPSVPLTALQPSAIAMPARSPSVSLSLPVPLSRHNTSVVSAPSTTSLWGHSAVPPPTPTQRDSAMGSGVPPPPASPSLAQNLNIPVPTLHTPAQASSPPPPSQISSTSMTTHGATYPQVPLPTGVPSAVPLAASPPISSPIATPTPAAHSLASPTTLAVPHTASIPVSYLGFTPQSVSPAPGSPGTPLQTSTCRPSTIESAFSLLQMSPSPRGVSVPQPTAPVGGTHTLYAPPMAVPIASSPKPIEQTTAPPTVQTPSMSGLTVPTPVPASPQGIYSSTTSRPLTAQPVPLQSPPGFSSLGSPRMSSLVPPSPVAAVPPAVPVQLTSERRSSRTSTSGSHRDKERSRHSSHHHHRRSDGY